VHKDIFEELYRKYHTKALRYVFSLCRDMDLAEDIVSEAFVKAFTSLDDEQPSFQFWLYRVCKNLWIDYLRKNKNISDEEIPEPVSYTTPESLKIEDERKMALWNAVNSLDSADREMVVLYYFSSLPLKEISLSMKKSYTSVRQRMVRIKAILKKKMEEQGYDF